MRVPKKKNARPTRILLESRNAKSALSETKLIAKEFGGGFMRVDLGQVVSKYIGETEKNLRRIFATAERTGAILFFDEADALFGKRTSVKDAHDRYSTATVERVKAYLRAYSGPVIFATACRDCLDGRMVGKFSLIARRPVSDSGTSKNRNHEKHELHEK